jgi:hypothetical protein
MEERNGCGTRALIRVLQASMSIGGLDRPKYGYRPKALV